MNGLGFNDSGRLIFSNGIILELEKMNEEEFDDQMLMEAAPGAN